jgi:hypothetical protein
MCSILAAFTASLIGAPWAETVNQINVIVKMIIIFRLQHFFHALYLETSTYIHIPRV